MVIYLKYYRCRCLRWFKYKFMYHEKEKAATGLEPVTAKPFLPNPYLDYFDKLEFGVCFINFFQSTQVRSWNPYFFQVHLWLLRNMIF